MTDVEQQLCVEIGRAVGVQEGGRWQCGDRQYVVNMSINGDQLVVWVTDLMHNVALPLPPRWFELNNPQLIDNIINYLMGE